MEFADESHVNDIFSSSAYNDESIGVPTQSHFLWFKAVNRKSAKLKQATKFNLEMEYSTKCIGLDELKESLLTCYNVS